MISTSQNGFSRWRTRSASLCTQSIRQYTASASGTRMASARSMGPPRAPTGRRKLTKR